MARQDALQGSLPLLVLKLLERRGPLHGYALTAQIEGMSNETLRVEEGSLYPALHRLEEAGWLDSKWESSENNRRAKYYTLTKTGTKQLGQETAQWNRIALAIARALEA